MRNVLEERVTGAGNHAVPREYCPPPGEEFYGHNQIRVKIYALDSA